MPHPGFKERVGQTREVRPVPQSETPAQLGDATRPQPLTYLRDQAERRAHASSHPRRRGGSFWWRRFRRTPERTVILGAGEVGQLVARKVRQHPEYGLELVGLLDDEPRRRRADLADLRVLGSLNDLPSLVRRLRVERVIVAFSNEPDLGTLETLRALRDQDVTIEVVPRLFELIGPASQLRTIEGLPVVRVPPPRLSGPSRSAKRAIDVVGATIGLVATAPLFAYVAWRIRRDSPGPILFRQTRLGIGESEFTALKFRTMHTGTSDSEHREFIRDAMDPSAAPRSSGLYKHEHEHAVTDVGRWLRRTSLDELPQLWNVLRGEMSLVGPRPCIPYEVEHFEPHHFDRFLMPAGITGYWQVTARAHSTFREALDLDVAYVRSWSLALDLRLLLATPAQLPRRGTA